MLSMIAAMTSDRVIGKDGEMPWHMPADLAWFRRNTVRKPVIMGRKTWYSIGKALPKRRNIVISRDATLQLPDTEVVHSPDAALALVAGEEEVVVMGGAQIYNAFLDQADRLYLTLIHADIAGDTWFPDYTPASWRELERVDQPADEKNAHPYSFVVLERVQ